MYLVFGLVLLLPFGIVTQILRISFLEGSGLRELWSTQTIDYLTIPAQRGNIYDRSGSLLATNSVAYKVAVDPKVPEMKSATIEDVCRTLSENTRRSPQFYLNKIRSASPRSRYIVLEKNISAQAYEELQALDVRGLILEEEYRRNYNFGTLSSHVLGFVNHNMDGITGLESH